MTTTQRLAAEIKLARVQMGLSQEQLAEILDVTPTHVKHLESGHRKPSVELLFVLAQTLHFSLDEIVFPSISQKEQLRIQIDSLLEGCSEKEHRLIRDMITSIIKNR